MSPRNAVVAVVLFAMLWQAAAWLVPDARSRHAEQLGHLLVHMQAVTHHHVVDQSLLLEAGSDDRPHQHESGGLQPGILISANGADIGAPPPSLPAAVPRGVKPSIVLDGPLRPPRA